MRGSFFQSKLDAAGNALFSSRCDLSYVIENARWVIAEDGKSITDSLNRMGGLKARATRSPHFLSSRVCHFGNEHLANGIYSEHRNGKMLKVLTWFHVVPGHSMNAVHVRNQSAFSYVHTSCTMTRDALLNLGIREELLKVIPLGVDLRLFSVTNNRSREGVRQHMHITADTLVIGSFQKDGVGWGTGNQPKLIKGPDILVEVVKKLASRYPVHVLLTGPARGFVTTNLRDIGVPFTHVGYISDYGDIARYYRALDLYVVTSRIEGGPKAILEAWASGVPVVSTRVGMVPDIATDGETALLADVEDTESLYSHCCRLIENSQLRNHLANNGSRAVQEYSWDRIARQYYDQIYSKLLRAQK